MKAKFLYSLSLLLITILFESSAYAQAQDATKLPPITITANVNVSAKVSQAFKKYFNNAEGVKWKELNENFWVSFIMNDQRNTALFKNNGYLIYHVSYGSEKNLPADLRKRIKTSLEYFDYKIGYVFNVNQDKRNIWVVNLEDDRTIVFIRIEDDILEEVERLRKPVKL
jgi:hypothetical protein